MASSSCFHGSKHRTAAGKMAPVSTVDLAGSEDPAAARLQTYLEGCKDIACAACFEQNQHCLSGTELNF